MNLRDKINIRVEVLFETDGTRILDSETAKLLKLIDKYNSIYLASKALGLAYSRAWDRLAKIEATLGVKVVEKVRGGRGGGGTKLTKYGKELLRFYEETVKALGLTFEIHEKPKVRPQILIVGSNDILLELFIGYLRRKYKINVETSWIGSSGGLAALMLNEADVATAHLYDPETRMYNKPFLKNYWLEDKAEIIKGYLREQVLAYHPSLSFNSIDEVLESLIKGELRLVNRNLGSGTRVHLDYMLRGFCKRRNLNFHQVIKRIKGYNVEVFSHLETAKMIAEGKAEVGLMLRYAAEVYKLKYIHYTWEEYDFIILKDKMRNENVKLFINELQSKSLIDIAKTLIGYKVRSM